MSNIERETEREKRHRGRDRDRDADGDRQAERETITITNDVYLFVSNSKYYENQGFYASLIDGSSELLASFTSAPTAAWSAK